MYIVFFNAVKKIWDPCPQGYNSLSPLRPLCIYLLYLYLFMLVLPVSAANSPDEDWVSGELMLREIAVVVDVCLHQSVSLVVDPC